MGMIRAIGLIFFLTILIGGCIVANNSSPPIEMIIDQEPVEITWGEAIEYIMMGEVQTLARTDQMIIMVLKNGLIISAELPSKEILEEELIRCGPLCQAINQLSL